MHARSINQFESKHTSYFYLLLHDIVGKSSVKKRKDEAMMNLNAHTETPELDLSSALFCEMLRREQRSEEIARTALHLGSFAMRFARVERVPRYDETSRENDAENSCML
jgi:hypothetical protein